MAIVGQVERNERTRCVKKSFDRAHYAGSLYKATIVRLYPPLAKFHTLTRSYNDYLFLSLLVQLTPTLNISLVITL